MLECYLISGLLYCLGPEMSSFFDAIAAVEGNSISLSQQEHIGPYQISQAYWQDSKIPGSRLFCLSSRYSKRVMLAYWQRYVPRALENQDYETLARVHYGGPYGHKLPSTRFYWQQVKQHLGN